MSLSKTDFDGFEEYFFENKDGAKVRYNNLHDEFKSIFNKIINVGCSTDFKSAQKGASTILFLRAAKYLFTAHNLSIEGHTEEARILLRSIVELIMLAYLISESDEVYKLWQECTESRRKHTDRNGEVNVVAFKEQKYKVNEIIKSYGNLFANSKKTGHLKRTRGEFSEFFSHENLFNIVPRVEFGKEKSEIYIGDSFKSNTGRMPRIVQMTIDIATDILGLVQAMIPVK